MNEFDCIIEYLERHGSKVDAVRYYHEGIGWTTSDVYVTMGTKEGRDEKDVYVFGNLHISAQLQGTIVLTNQNTLRFVLTTKLKGLDEIGIIEQNLSIGDGLNSLGNGYYEGSKRLYGVGFNRISYTRVGIGAAAPVVFWSFNGYIFLMK